MFTKKRPIKAKWAFSFLNFTFINLKQFFGFTIPIFIFLKF